jgi:anti-sigma regulatory factor (Ser/Thr protein kinase)
MHEIQITIPGDVNRITPATAKIADYCRLVGFSDEKCFHIQVVLAEAINNIIAYASPEKPISLHCLFDDEQKQMVIEMIDQGTPFEMTPRFDFPECEAESGRGWPIIFSWMDGVSHVRQGDENHLTLKKGLN